MNDLKFKRYKITLLYSEYLNMPMNISYFILISYKMTQCKNKIEMKLNKVLFLMN